MKEYQNDMPYTIVGHSAIQKPILSITLTAEGIKELAKRMKDDDRVIITEWTEYTNEFQEAKYFSKIEIIRKSRKGGDKNEKM